MIVDIRIDNVSLATMDQNHSTPYGAIGNAWLAISEGKIHSLGVNDDNKPGAHSVIDGDGAWLTPGLIDCHTHLLWGGNRAQEFEWRLQGQSYEDISKAGGGIASTVSATRKASDEDLLNAGQKRLQALMNEGVTTVEIKSGYGLSLEHELRLLRLAQHLDINNDVTISKTLLAAHALPPEFKSNAEAYIDEVCNNIIPAAAEQQLADCVDVFCEGVGFTPEQCRRVFEAAQQHSLGIKGHVEQLSDLKGAKLVAEFGGWSADHIEFLKAEDVKYLAKSKTVAVLLPGAFYCLQESQRPPVDALRSCQVAMAVASDLNPGTSPLASLRLAMNQACVLFGLTPEESLAGVTRNAAQALSLQACKGQLKPSYDADIILWDINHPSELSYGFNLVSPSVVIQAGKVVKS